MRRDHAFTEPTICLFINLTIAFETLYQALCWALGKMATAELPWHLWELIVQ